MAYKTIILTFFITLVGISTNTIAGNDGKKKKSSTTANLKGGTAFEVSPHTGMMGKSGVFGLRMAMNYGAINIEIAGEQAIGETANLYPIMLNFALNLTTRGQFLPYGLIGGGLFLTVPTHSVGSGTVSTMGLNFGGGMRYYITKKFGLRLEVKQFMTNITNELTNENETLLFQEISIGATFLFR